MQAGMLFNVLTVHVSFGRGRLCSRCHPVDGQALVKLAKQVKPRRPFVIRHMRNPSCMHKAKVHGFTDSVLRCGTGAMKDDIQKWIGRYLGRPENAQNALGTSINGKYADVGFHTVRVATSMEP